MTLREWQDAMAERFAGRFAVNAFNEIRHKTFTDARGEQCCPMIAYSADPSCTGKVTVDGENRCADTYGMALGLQDRDVCSIMDVADYNYDDSLEDNESLRDWMERVLVKGEVGEVAS